MPRPPSCSGPSPCTPAISGRGGPFELSLAERRDRGDEHTAARHLGGLGTALLNLGDLARARAVLEESLVVARRYDDQWC